MDILAFRSINLFADLGDLAIFNDLDVDRQFLFPALCISFLRQGEREKTGHQ
jgi:hypothetical protein